MPNSEKAGKSTKGNAVSKIPPKKDAMIAPFNPPLIEPKTPMVPPEKKAIPAAGKSTTGEPIAAMANVAVNPPINEVIKPTGTMVGAYWKNTGTSTAGIDPGIYFSEIATKAAVNSAIN